MDIFPAIISSNHCMEQIWVPNHMYVPPHEHQQEEQLEPPPTL